MIILLPETGPVDAVLVSLFSVIGRGALNRKRPMLPGATGVTCGRGPVPDAVFGEVKEYGLFVAAVTGRRGA